MEYQPQRMGVLHNQCTSGKYIVVLPTKKKLPHFCKRTDEKHFRFMSATQRSTSKIAKILIDTAIRICFSWRRDDYATPNDALIVAEGFPSEICKLCK